MKYIYFITYIVGEQTQKRNERVRKEERKRKEKEGD